MRPVLLSLHFGSREIGVHTYGVLIAVGIAAGIAVAYREARRRHLDGGRVLDLAFWMTVAGLVGSRLAYGIVNAGAFARTCAGSDLDAGTGRTLWGALVDCTRVLHVWEGGLVFYGGAVGAVLVAARFARRERSDGHPDRVPGPSRDDSARRSRAPSTRWSFWQVGDIFAPALALGHAFGRLGCFAAGCCFGKAAAGGWGVAFPRGSVAFDELASVGGVGPAATLTPPLHATQLYEAIGEAAVFGLLLVLRPRLRRRPGALFLVYAALYPLLRFAVEMFRGDFARLYVVPLVTPRLAAWLRLPPGEPILLSVGQLTSVVILAAAIAAFVARRRAWLRAG
jgi:phosphatidylglycerol:prolipoprotein diacylglycerol transferase